jgi:hypothetical protein
MAVVAKCPHCGEKVIVSSRRLGDRARCTECQRTFPVPPGAASKLLGMLKVTLLVLLLVGILAVLRYAFNLTPSAWFSNW